MHALTLPILGILVLFLGRRLFWLSVAALGFVIGMESAPQLFPQQPTIYVFVFALILGVIGALIAVLLQEIAIGIAGFFFGGHLSVVLANALGFAHSGTLWIVFLVGGVLGAILMLAFFGWGLIILSSLLGAHLIVESVHLPSATKMLLFLGLVICGIVVQASLPQRRRVAVE